MFEKINEHNFIYANIYLSTYSFMPNIYLYVQSHMHIDNKLLLFFLQIHQFYLSSFPTVNGAGLGVQLSNDH